MNNKKQTIAQQRNVTEFPFIIKDDNGNETYWEDSNGVWEKSTYDENGNQTSYEDSNGVKNN